MDREAHLNVTGRIPADIRREVIHAFLAEEPGTETETNHYTYWVEALADGSRIYLRRPASLHKGMDFAILCEGHWQFKNGNDRPPRHRDLSAELCALAAVSGRQREELRGALQKIWLCEPPEEVVGSLSLLRGNVSAERALKLARWMFIEQDLAYWTGQGRSMLKAALEKELSTT